MNTLLLDRSIWDLTTDANGNIAMASNPYSEAQDVSSAVRVFKGEVYYDTTQGIPYFEQIFGARPNLQFVKAQVEQAALTVPGIVQAQCVFVSFVNRVLTGQIQTIDADGAARSITF